MNGALTRLASSLPCDAILSGDLPGRMKSSGYEAVYPGDLFIAVPEPGMPFPEEDLVFSDASSPVLLRPLSEVEAICARLSGVGLGMDSAHFMETLPPPGQGPESIFPVHGRFLEIASLAGLKHVTTHVGAMFKMPPGKPGMTLQELCRFALEVYGPEKAVEDSIAVYRNLCREAAKLNIAVTIETGCVELPEISCDIGRLLEFIKTVGAGNLGVCIDTGHCNVNRMPIGETLRRCGPLLMETHVHDNYGAFDTHGPLGEGDIEWPVFVSALEGIGYKGLITFEQSDFERNAVAWRSLLSSRRGS